MIEQLRLLSLRAAHMMDAVGNKKAKQEIAIIKIAVPSMACQVVDWPTRRSEAAAPAMTSASQRPMPRPGFCVWRMARTKSTATNWLGTSSRRSEPRMLKVECATGARSLEYLARPECLIGESGNSKKFKDLVRRNDG